MELENYSCIQLHTAAVYSYLYSLPIQLPHNFQSSHPTFLFNATSHPVAQLLNSDINSKRNETTSVSHVFRLFRFEAKLFLKAKPAHPSSTRLPPSCAALGGGDECNFLLTIWGGRRTQMVSKKFHSSCCMTSQLPNLPGYLGAAGIRVYPAKEAVTKGCRK
jgi:hypothetical protein